MERKTKVNAEEGKQELIMTREFELPLLKEWAYAGFFFVASGAAVSHIVTCDTPSEIIPSLLLLVLTIVILVFQAFGQKNFNLKNTYKNEEIQNTTGTN